MRNENENPGAAGTPTGANVPLPAKGRKTMSKLHKKRAKRQVLSHPTPFDWLVERELKATDPAPR